MPTAGQLIATLNAAQVTKATEDQDLALAQTDATTADAAVYDAAVEIGLVVTPLLKDKPSLEGFIDGLAQVQTSEVVTTHEERLMTLARALKAEFLRHTFEWAEV